MDAKKSNLPSIELILDYVDGLLDSSQSDKLRNRENSDEFFKGIVDGVRHFQKAGKSRDEIEIYLQTLSKLKVPVSKSKAKWIPYSIAASIIIILSLVGYLFLNSTDIQDIAERELAIVYPPPTTTRGVSELNEHFLKAAIQYAEGNFDEAVASFSLAIEGEPNNITCQFYLGLSNLYSKNPDYNEAIRNLVTASETDNLISIRATWYLALVYIQQNELTKAKQYLQKVVEDNSFKSDEASTLLENF